jgi:cysteine desulfurase
MPYLDYAATAPMRSAALDAYAEAARKVGNAASLHAWGRRADQRLDAARKAVGALVGRPARQVYWTAGGTEANNVAILGLAARTEKRKLVVSAIEHKAVLAPAAALEAQGWTVTRVGVDGDGVLRLDALEAALGPDVALVSVMAANNEVGALQPLAEAAALAHAAGARFHTDAVQAAGLIDLSGVAADLITLSAHKLGGPMGVGALVVAPGVPLGPVLHGGGHERGLRPGTLNVPGVVAFGAAAEEALASRASEAARLAALRDRLRAGVLAGVPWARALGRPEALAPHVAAFALPGLDGEGLVQQLDLAGLGASSGAACSALGTDPSHVLPELGLDAASVNGSLRLSVGWATTDAEVDEAIATVCRVAGMLRDMPPMAL